MPRMIYFLCLCCISLAFAQKEKTIRGLILVDNLPASEVVVINLTKEKVTVSDAQGSFEISASEDDLLTFSAVHLHYWRQSVDAKTMTSGGMIVNLSEKTTDLEEVEVVQYTHINAFDLGIIDRKIKTLTPAERRLKLAGDFKYYHLLNILGGSLDVEPIINKISGRTKRLKKELKHEQKERLIEVLNSKFENDFYIEKLKIPAEYLNGFKQYCVEFPIEPLLEAIDKNKLELELTLLATDFLAYLYEE